jgi:hypothetical protein
VLTPMSNGHAYQIYPDRKRLPVGVLGANCRFARIVALDGVPIGPRPAMRREAEQRFERDVAMKAAVVAKDEFIEVNVDVFTPQAVIRA